MHPLVREKTRILRPWEHKQLYNAVPKKDFKTMLNALLLSGMRYVEMQRFQKNPEWFDGEFIHLPEEAILKHERKQVERDVILNPLGKNVYSTFSPTWLEYSPFRLDNSFRRIKPFFLYPLMKLFPKTQMFGFAILGTHNYHLIFLSYFT